MTTILFVVLIISQLLSFYFLIILNTKLSKYKAIEAKQEAIIREMDDAIAAYLVELKDENDRFIEKLTQASVRAKSNEQRVVQKNETPSFIASNESKASASSELITQQANEQKIVPLKVEEKQPTVEMPKIVPKTVVKNAYQKQTSAKKVTAEEMPKNNESATQPLTSFEQQVVSLHHAGLSIDEIAKKTQKGKTEIELLIKFHA